MRNGVRGLAVAALFLGSVSSHSSNESGRVQIMTTGQYHGDEIAAPFGVAKGWLALIVSDHHTDLVPSSPKVVRVFDPVIDEESVKSSYSGKLVEESKHDPLLLIKASWLKSGQIAQAKLTNNGQGFAWNDQQFKLLHVCGKASSKESLLPCKVELSDGKGRQFIIETAEPNEAYTDEFANTVKIIWAGDIDRDGKPDFILHNTHYNGENIQLYLSSKADKTHFVESVARAYRVGC